MKKKIAVVFNRMIIGGAEKSLIQFLKSIDKTRYDITLFTRNGNCAFFSQIPNDVHVVFTETETPSDVMLDDLKHLRLLRVFKGLLCRIAVRFAKDHFQDFYYSMRTYRPLPGHFDCAIAYKLGCEDTALVLTRVSADKKCGFVHHIVDPASDGGVFNYMDPIEKVFCVSNYAKSIIDSQYPHLASRTDVFHNMVDEQEILEKGQEAIPESLQKPTIVTVGRLDKEKGQDMIPKAVRLLADSGHDVFWYLIGDGALRDTVQAEIVKYNVSDRVFLLGAKANPYPYMKQCDIYVQTSRSEGWCLTTQEAKLFCKPIITTDLPVMREQFTDGVNGLIAEDASPEALANAIRTILEQPQLAQQLTETLTKSPSTNQYDFKKLYTFMES